LCSAQLQSLKQAPETALKGLYDQLLVCVASATGKTRLQHVPSLEHV